MASTSRLPVGKVRTESRERLSVLLAEKQRREKAKTLLVKAEESLRAFVELCWPIIEPGTPFLPGWHIDAICDHLQAVSNGEIQKLIINIPPRHGKPVSCDEPVLERTRGRIKLSDVRVGDEVLTHMGRFRRVLAVYEQGELPLVAVTTHGGRVIKAAADHSFLSTRGWVQAGSLTDRDVLATVHPVQASGTHTMTPEEARLLGYIVADGACQGSGLRITKADPDVLTDIEHCVASAGFNSRRRSKQGTPAVDVLVTDKKDGEKRGKFGPVRSWLIKHELNGCTSYTKRVPPAIMAATPDLIAEFISAYWTYDGSVAVRSGSRTDCCIECTSVSEGLMRGIQHLLTRIGIQSRVRKKVAKLKSKRQGTLYTSWMCVISSMDFGSKFASVIRLKSLPKAALLARYSRCAFDKVLNEDPVVSVEPAGVGPCRCLRVEVDETFAVQDVVVHNSSLVSVMWPAWTWLTRPETRWMFSAYAESLSIRDSVKCRHIIRSPLYQRNWSDRFMLANDQDEKRRFENDRTGYRLASSVGGTNVGEGGDFIVCDDPNDVNQVESDIVRNGVNEWWDYVMSTRGNTRRSAFVIIQQRCHAEDLSGHVLSQGGYEHLCLPARWEG